MEMLEIWCGDWVERLRLMADNSVHCCVTSPPYWGLRDYGVGGQLGLEKTPEEYVAKVVEGFREVRRVLRDDGTLWLNLGDSYNSSSQNNHGSGGPMPKNGLAVEYGKWAGHRKNVEGMKTKDLVGIPWMVAFALRADGWYLRSDIIWHKPNPMPESVTDRPTKSHEYIFLLSKSERYFYDAISIMEPAKYGEEHANKSTSWGTNRKHPNKANVDDYAFAGENHTTSRMEDGEYGRNKRSVWTVPTAPYKGAHFATFPPDLIKPCILAGTSAKGCCPKCGAPWERVVETNNPSKHANTGDDMTGGAAKTGNPQTSNGLHRNGGGVYSTASTIGWQPTCSCSPEPCGDCDACVGGHPEQCAISPMLKPVPCVVLDPFGGSGTTGMVSLELGRRAWLIELNPEYVKLIERRCDVTRGLQLA